MTDATLATASRIERIRQMRSLAPSRTTTALILAAFGGAAVLSSRRRTRQLGRTLGVVGVLALVGVVIRLPVVNAVRKAGTRRRTASVRFSFVVDRPVEQVFAFCADFENFPRFIGSLRDVKDTGDGRSHWCAFTPGGGTVEWDAVTTKFVTNSVIGWRSVANSPVTTKGVLRFRPEGEGTCVSVVIDYSVKDGSFRDSLAALVTRRRKGALEAEFRGFQSVMPEAPAVDVASELPVTTEPSPAG